MRVDIRNWDHVPGPLELLESTMLAVDREVMRGDLREVLEYLDLIHDPFSASGQQTMMNIYELLIWTKIPTAMRRHRALYVLVMHLRAAGWKVTVGGEHGGYLLISTLEQFPDLT